MKIELDKRFKKNVAGRFGRYGFEVGVLKDRAYKVPARGKRGLKGKDVITFYAGGPRRKVTSKNSGQTVADVSDSIREHLGFNYLTRPFSGKKKSAEIIAFTKVFFDIAFGRSQKRRAETLLQAIVRNPILRGDYGRNGRLTTRIKGFNRKLIDTAQTFKAIDPKCIDRGAKR